MTMTDPEAATAGDRARFHAHARNVAALLSDDLGVTVEATTDGTGVVLSVDAARLLLSAGLSRVVAVQP